MKSYFEAVAATPILLITFGLTVFFLAIVFPQLAGDIESLDMRTDGYDFSEAMAALNGYGEAGRARYAWVSPTLDTLFPICYASFYAGVLYRFVPHERLKILAYIPLLGGLFDLGENAQIVAMLVQYPDITMAQVDLANRFTLTKFAFTRASMVLASAALIWGLGAYCWRLRRNEDDNAPA